MERAEAIKHAEAALQCIKYKTACYSCDDDCDNCELMYAKGNMGEIKQWLEIAIHDMKCCLHFTQEERGF